MGKDSELFKAAKAGNNVVLEKAFSYYLRKTSLGQHSGYTLGSIRNKTHPNIQDDSGCTLLHHSTLHGQRETVSLLLKCGASTTITDSSGSCPLHLAAWKGDGEIVRLLVTQGPSRANVNQQSDSDDTALHLASQFGYSNVVEFLLERHADPLLRNAKGETPLDLAAQYGHLDAVHLLVSHCPEILQQRRLDFSPLHLAARNGHSVVALSLINAGIPVNITCDSGSALHEAAVCGKAETVQLLLDKGVDLSLADGRGRTALQLLEEYPSAERAREIQRIIQAHVEHGRRSGSVPLKEKRILAVAQITCTPVIAGSEALAFNKGDTIAVLKKSSTGVYFGTSNGQTGSFLAQDVVFFKEKGGHLIATDVSRLSEDSDEEREGPGRETTPPQTLRNIAVSAKPPYEHIPGFPNRDSMATVSSEVTSPNSAHPEMFEMSLQTERGQRSSMPPPTDGGQRSSIPPPTDGGQRLSVAPPTDAGGGYDISSKRMSKKEKRFQLSKDDGAYSELTEINPHQAKKEFGQTLRLNPVGPAFPAQTDQSDLSQSTTTSHNASAVEEDPEQQYLGSYYVLEVGNFEKDSTGNRVTPPPLPPNIEHHQQQQQVPPGGGISLVPQPSAGGGQPEQSQAGYFMLDIKNFQEENNPSEVAAGNRRSRKSPSPLDTSQEGKSPPPPSVGARSASAAVVEEEEESSDDRFYDTPRYVSSHLAANPHLLERFNQSLHSSQATPPITPQEQYVNVKTKGAPSYENYPLPRQDTPTNLTPTLGDSSSTSVSSLSPFYSTVALDQESRKPQIADTEAPRKSPSKARKPARGGGSSSNKPYPPTSGGAYKDLPLSSLYENVPAARPEKVRGGVSSEPRPVECGGVSKLRSREPSPLLNVTAAPDDAVATGNASSYQIAGNSAEDKLKRKSLRREQIYESVSVGVKSQPRKKSATAGLKSSSDNDLSPQGNPVEEGLNGKSLSQASLESTGIIENRDNPFAGLVISSSRQLDEEGSTLSTPTHQQQQEAGPFPFRNRTETVWDNDRVEREWDQIDTTLRRIDMEVPPPPSGSRDPSPSNNQPGDSSNVAEWLKGFGMERYSDVFLSNGFDDLRFLGGAVLAMDDLEDIGISDKTDQYDIMAVVSLLEAPPPVRHAPSVSEWLHLLCLPQLQAQFSGYSLKKLSTLWDIQLATVVGVELLGHRKRLQYGIAELRSAHPEWRTTLPPSHPHTSPSSSPISSVSFLKDYRKIRPKSSPRTSQTELSNRGSPQRRPLFPRQDTDIAMRPPLQAQAAALGGRGSRECCMPSDQWSHPTPALIREAVSYSVKYLGSVIVKRLHGNQSAEEACLKLRLSTENMMKVPEIILSISWKGVKFVDGHTKVVVSTHAVRDISYCTPDIEEPKVFAYITKDQERNYCHVFSASSKETADEIRMTIGQAFEICYQKVMKARRGSSHSATSADSSS